VNRVGFEGFLIGFGLVHAVEGEAVWVWDAGLVAEARAALYHSHLISEIKGLFEC
jgi:hypothetical protein